MDGALGRVEVVDDAEITDSQRVAAMLVAFQRFAGVWLRDERIDGVDKLGQDRVVLAAKRFQVLGRARINDDAPTT